jgi:hypothetical protein
MLSCKSYALWGPVIAGKMVAADFAIECYRISAACLL